MYMLTGDEERACNKKPIILFGNLLEDMRNYY